MTPKPARHVVRWWLKVTGFSGITLPPWGVYILDDRLSDNKLIKHEQAHWRQWQRMGTIRFYVVYLFGLVRYGYRNHPMEVEARAESLRG